MSDANAATLFVGDPSIVDPKIHELIEGVLPPDQQSLNLEILRHPEHTLAEAAAALLQVGMFAADRVVWVRDYSPAPKRGKGEGGDDELDGLLEQLESSRPASVSLVISARSVDKRSKLYKWFDRNGAIVDLRVGTDRTGRLDPEQAARLVADRLAAAGVADVQRGAVQEILKRAPTSAGELLQEVDRLAVALDDGEAFTAAFVERNMRDAAAAWVFDLTDAISARALARCQSLVGRLLEGGEPPIRLAALVAGHVATLVEARSVLPELPRGALERRAGDFVRGPFTRLPEWFRKRHNPYRAYHVLRGAGAFTEGELLALHRAVLQLDSRLKSSRQRPVLLFEAFLQQACAPSLD